MIIDYVRNKKMAKEIRKSGLFDESYYIKQCYSLKDGIDLVEHYIKYGVELGLDPSKCFSTTFYVKKYKDINIYKINPFYHFIKYGSKEGRIGTENINNNKNITDFKFIDRVNIYFDSNYYLSHNADVEFSGVDPLWHYLNFGWKEKRNPCEWFDVDFYLSENRDVSISSIEPFSHYLSDGVKEGRRFYKREQKLSSFSDGFIRDEAVRIYGGIFYVYILELKKYIVRHSPSKIFFLSREGYFLKRIYDNLVDAGLVKFVPSEELMVSRAFLFKILLFSGKDISLALDLSYKGTLKNLLKDRFCLNDKEILSQKLSYSLEIELPRDKDKVVKCLSNFITDNELLNNEYEDYVLYLNSTGFFEQECPMVVDLGYAGTIQKLLSILFEKNTKGFYFINTNKKPFDIFEGKKVEYYGCLYNNIKFGEGYSLLDRSLILEGLLTAPYGQLRGINKISNRFIFIRGCKTVSQKHFHMLEIMIDAILDYINSIGVIGGENKEIKRGILINFDNETKLRSVIYDILELDDNISGIGLINPNIITW